MLSCSVMSNSLRSQGLQPTRLLCPWGFSRQEYCNELSCPPSGCLPNSGIEPRSPALQANSLPTQPPGKPQTSYCCCVIRSVLSDSAGPSWTVAHQAPLSMGFSRQEYWSGLPFPSPGICSFSFVYI